MKAAFFAGNKKLELRDIPKPVPKDGQVLVKISGAALCGSDMKHYYCRQSCKTVMGHENSGIVAETRSKLWKEGDRVILYALSGCYKCPACKKGVIMYCPELSYVTGGFSEYAVVNGRDCLKIPYWMNTKEACIFGDSIGLPYRTLERLYVKKGQTLVILGVGPVGMGVLLMAGAKGLKTIAVDINQYRLDKAVQLGAGHAFNAKAEDLEEQIRNAVGPFGPDAVVDCAGRENTQLLAMKLCKKGGNVGFLGGNTSLCFNPNELILAKELRISGNWYFNIKNFDKISKFINGKIELSSIITHYFSLEQIQQAFDLFASGNCVKVVLKP
jgi:L-iditol 2-dehydrogenase